LKCVFNRLLKSFRILVSSPRGNPEVSDIAFADKIPHRNTQFSKNSAQILGHRTLQEYVRLFGIGFCVPTNLSSPSSSLKSAASGTVSCPRTICCQDVFSIIASILE
jgi:hypothetical protein